MKELRALIKAKMVDEINQNYVTMPLKTLAEVQNQLLTIDAIKMSRVRRLLKRKPNLAQKLVKLVTRKPDILDKLRNTTNY